MLSSFRYFMSTVGGGTVAVGLGLAMVSMIRVEFTAQNKGETYGFEINPQVTELPVIPDNRRELELKKVEVPPAPPVIDKANPEQVPVPPIKDPGPVDIPIGPISIDTNNFTIIAENQQESPLVRIPPVMPPRASKSGRCELQFDLSPNGTPFNIVATYCSESHFKRPSVKSVARWKYRPRIVDGQGVTRTGLRETIIFKLLDERGKLIPE